VCEVAGLDRKQPLQLEFRVVLEGEPKNVVCYAGKTKCAFFSAVCRDRAMQILVEAVREYPSR
jgi:hypothetical protein